MYGAACFLNSSDYLSYFDEDNVLDADHVSSVLHAMEARHVAFEIAAGRMESAK